MSALELLAKMREQSNNVDKEEGGAVRTMVTFLAKAAKAPDDMLRFFDRGSFYTLIGRDAEFVTINLKGRLQKIPIELVEAVRLPTAQTEAGDPYN